jgi:hypothetical protein
MCLFWITLTDSRAQTVPTQFYPSGVSGGGYVLNVAVNPENSSQLLLGCDMMGLYRTTNKGSSWQMVPSGNFNAYRRAELQYAGSGAAQRVYGIRLHSWKSKRTGPAYSNDGGQTWQWIGLPRPSTDGDAYYGLAVDPAGASHSTQRMVVDDYRSIWCSANGGTSWTLVTEYPGPNAPGYPDSIRLAGAYWNGNTVYVGTSLGVYVSTANGVAGSWSSYTMAGAPTRPQTPAPDAPAPIVDFCGAKHPTTGAVTLFATFLDDVVGNDWDSRTLDDGWPYFGLYTALIPGSGTPSWVQRPGPDNIAFARVDVPSNDSRKVWAVTPFDNPPPKVCKSLDGGITWVNTFNVSNNGNITTAMQGDGSYFGWGYGGATFGLDVSDNNPNVVAICGTWSYITDNGGLDWNQLNVRSNTANPKNQSIPQPKSYQHNGLGVTSVNHVHWLNSNTSFVSTCDIGLQRSGDGGKTWSLDYQPNDGAGSLLWNNWYAMAQAPGGTRLYAAVANINDIYESERLADDKIFGTLGAILTSADGGLLWESTSMPISNGPVVDVAVNSAQTSTIYASTVKSNFGTTPPDVGGIYRSTNQGVSWTKLASPPRTEGRAYNIKVLAANTLLATYCARTVNGAATMSSGVFYSTDGGSSWLDRSGPTGWNNLRYFTRDISVEPAAPTTNWFVSVQSHMLNSWPAAPVYDNHGGVYRTTNAGVGWIDISSSLPVDAKNSVQSVTYIPGATPLLYVTTGTAGLWVSSNPNAASPTFTKVTAFPFDRAKRVFADPYGSPGSIWVTTQGGGVWRSSTPFSTMTATVLRNGSNFDFQVDLSEATSAAPSLAGKVDLGTSGGWTVLTGITPSVTTGPNGFNRYTWPSVNLHALFGSSAKGYVRATRTTANGFLDASDVGGWISESIATSTTETWGVPWVKTPVYRGLGSTSGGAIQLLGPGASSFTAGRQYYLEISEGEFEGHRLEVNESGSTATVIAVDLTHPLSTLSNLPNMVRTPLRVREHWRFGEVFPKAVFHGTNNPSTSDRILIWSGTSYSIYWNNVNATNDRWLSANNANSTDVSDTLVVPPGVGYFVNPRNAMPGPLYSYGLARDHDFSQRLPTGDSFVGSAFPLDLGPRRQNLLQGDGFVWSNNPTIADRLLVWLGDDSATQQWEGYAYLGPITSMGGAVYWTIQSNALLQNYDDVSFLKLHRATMIKAYSAPKPQRIVRCPWVP